LRCGAGDVRSDFERCRVVRESIQSVLGRS